MGHAIRVIRLAFMHDIGGRFDFSHSGEKEYNASAEMGNFFYGANGAAMGIPVSVLIKGSAAYQSITDAGGWINGFEQGVQNFINNEGDNLGDAAQVMRGIRYFNEVLKPNIDNISENNMSCLDDATAESLSGNNSVDGVVGGGFIMPIGGNPASGGFFVPPFNGGEEWCFVQSGYRTYCWIE